MYTLVVEVYVPMQGFASELLSFVKCSSKHNSLLKMSRKSRYTWDICRPLKSYKFVANADSDLIFSSNFTIYKTPILAQNTHLRAASGLLRIS